MPLSFTPIQIPQLDAQDFDLLSFGEQCLPNTPVKFGFQVDLKVQPGMREIVFGLVNLNQGRVAQQPAGFAIRIDLERGEIWDIMNDSGLVGWLERPLIGATSGSESHLLLSLEIERAGSALLPKLQIGGEEWLYPALRSSESLQLSAVAGTNARVSAEAAFSNPALWSEEE
jgi:hypothetical protein